MSTALELARKVITAGNDYGPSMLVLATALIEAEKQREQLQARIEELENEIHAWEESDAANAAGIFPPADDADRSEEAPLTDPRQR